jgi:hypothetical protein
MVIWYDCGKNRLPSDATVPSVASKTLRLKPSTKSGQKPWHLLGQFSSQSFLCELWSTLTVFSQWSFPTKLLMVRTLNRFQPQHRVPNFCNHPPDGTYLVPSRVVAGVVARLVAVGNHPTGVTRAPWILGVALFESIIATPRGRHRWPNHP